MTVEVRPLGVKCNIQCQYCYQMPQRDADNVGDRYDLEKMKVAIEREGGPFTLFGGEPLMVPERDLEELWSWGLEKYNHNTVQTNGTLINDNHIRMFKQYNVSVGISVDGPGELNDARWAGTLERTRRATDETHAAIERLCRLGTPPSLIITLHRNNATRDRLPVMYDWVKHLDRLGVTSVRLHILEVGDSSIREKYGLSAEENLESLLGFLELEGQLTALTFDIFRDMRNVLLGQDNSATCVWAACDPYTTHAVRGVEGHGQSSNCGHINKDGIDFLKCDRPGFERNVALFQTPQEHGGCKGCRFFAMCRGQCPGSGVDGDWRNRSNYCAVWKGLYRHIEEQMLDEGQVPLSVQPVRRQVEEAMVDAWNTGQNVNIAQVLMQLEQGSPTAGPQGHGDLPHGDRPHGDSSLHHTDAQTGVRRPVSRPQTPRAAPIEVAALEGLEAHYGDKLDELNIADICTGDYLTTVALTDGAQGAAINFFNVHGPHQVSYNAEHYDELLKRVSKTDNLLCRAFLKRTDLDHLAQSVKIAILNALSVHFLSQSQLQEHHLRAADGVVDIPALLRDGDTVGMIGCLGNYSCWQIGKLGFLKRIYFSDLEYVDSFRASVESFINKAFDSPNIVIPSDGTNNQMICESSDVVVIAAGTLCTRTLDELLEWSKEAREVLLTGWSYAMDPRPLFDRGVTGMTTQIAVHPNVVEFCREKLRKNDLGFTEEFVKCFRRLHVLRREMQ